MKGMHVTVCDFAVFCLHLLSFSTPLPILKLEVPCKWIGPFPAAFRRLSCDRIRPSQLVERAVTFVSRYVHLGSAKEYCETTQTFIPLVIIVLAKRRSYDSLGCSNSSYR